MEKPRRHTQALGLNLDRCYLTGDSAGALLSLFVLSIHGSTALQHTFGIQPSGISFRACGLISIMLDTQRHDLMRAIRDQVTDTHDQGKPYVPYLLDPVLLVREADLPPIWQVTSAEYLIHMDSLKLEKALTEHGTVHQLRDFPKGAERRLVHVFSVAYPMYPESRQVFQEMDAFFKAH